MARNKLNRKCNRYSGIGGQAVLEGIMMKNKDRYAVAVRRPDGEIAVEVEEYRGVLHDSKWTKLPFIRGTFNFLDSLILGMKVLNYSTSFYDEVEQDAQAQDTQNRVNRGSAVMEVLVALFSVCLAIGIFVVLPYFLSTIFEKYIRNASLVTIIEGCIRILIFLLYVWGISAMKDIRRLYQYHGAEHKCINCVEKGRPLTVHNVMRSSRQHRRCGTSFLFFVILVSVVLFFFIRVDNIWEKVGLRILLMPVVAGISYELIRLAGRSDHFLVKALSAPGMLIQRLTTREPDEEMAEVAIAAVEAVFDWRAYLNETFGYEVDDSWLDDAPKAEDEDDIDGTVDEGDAAGTDSAANADDVVADEEENV